MKSRRITLTTLSLAMAVSLVGCGGTATGQTDTPAATTAASKVSDSEFISAVQNGLESRWALGDISQTADFKTAMDGYIERADAEYDAVGAYVNREFENGETAEKARDYLAALEDFRDASENLKEGSTSSDSELWNAQDRRVLCIKYFVDNCGLTVSESYKSNLEELLADAEKAGTEHVDEFLITNCSAEPVDSYGYYDVDFTVKNNSDSAKNFLGFEVQELDADGNILSSYMSYNKNYAPALVQPGQEYHITLTEAAEDGIAGFRSTKYEWGESPSDPVEGTFSTPFEASVG